MLWDLVAAAIQRHEELHLHIGAWSRHHQLRLIDALYVHLVECATFPVFGRDVVERQQHVQVVADLHRRTGVGLVLGLADLGQDPAGVADLDEQGPSR